MDNEIHENIKGSELEAFILAAAKMGGKCTVELTSTDLYRILVSYPPIAEDIVLNNLRVAGGL